jgi:hypothetical protein
MSAMSTGKLAFLASTDVVPTNTMCATTVRWRPDGWKAAVGLEAKSNDQIWGELLRRGQSYRQKARGGVPDLSQVSWAELWGLTRCFETGLCYSAFHERCGHRPQGLAPFVRWGHSAAPISFPFDGRQTIAAVAGRALLVLRCRPAFIAIWFLAWSDPDLICYRFP